MITREKIMSSIKYVVDNAKDVKINIDNIDKAIDLLIQKQKDDWLKNDFLVLENFTQEQTIMYLIICESLNFCFWDSDIKWQIEYNGRWLSGSYGLFYAILRAIKNGHNFLDINYLKSLTIEELDDILKGTTSIPLLEERYKIIKQLAREFENINSLTETINASSDIELLNVIVNNFSNFNDVSLYNDEKVYFFKRATLLVGDLFSYLEYIKENIKNKDNILGAADYKIPQSLRHLGILEYSKKLAELVDNKKEIKHDDSMEIEIRACMLYAIELIRDKMNKSGIKINSVQIDNALWLLSKNKDFKDKPHHLTKTIYY